MTRLIMVARLGVPLVVALIVGIGYSQPPKTPPAKPGETIVYRDRFGLPHVFAETIPDLYFAFGYVTAQDGLVYAMRGPAGFLTQSGTMSAAFGSDFVNADYTIRLFKVPEISEAVYQRMGSSTKQVVDSYAAGFNRYVRDHRQELPDWVREIRPAEVVAQVLQPFTMRERADGKMDYLRGYVISRIGLEAWEEINPVQRFTPSIPNYRDAKTIRPKRGTIKLPPDQIEAIHAFRGAKHISSLDANPWANDSDQARHLAVADWKRDWTLDPVEGSGSSFWILSGKRTTTGSPILASVHHAGYERAMEVHLNSPGLKLAGIGLGPIIWEGRNAHLAWAMVRNHPDFNDIFVEKLNPDNPNQYLYDGQWEDVRVEQIEIPVRQPDGTMRAVRREAKHTRHGPVIGVSGNYAFAHRTTFVWENGYDAFTQLWRANAARNLDEFKAAWAMLQVPVWAVGAADDAGNIYYLYNTRSVERSLKYDRGLPVPGWTSESEWRQGAISFHQLPQVLNPPTGYVIYSHVNQPHWNQDSFPETVVRNSLWQLKPDIFARRITELLEAKKKLTPQEVWAVSNDDFCYYAKWLVPRILQAYESRKSELRDGQNLAEAIRLLAGWDYRITTDAQAVVLFRRFLELAFFELFEDEFGDATSALTVKTIKDGYPNWLVCITLRPDLGLTMDDVTYLQKYVDDRRTPATETVDDIILRCLRKSVTFVQAEYGKVAVPWGDVHLLKRGNRVYPLRGGDEFLRTLFTGDDYRFYPPPGDYRGPRTQYGTWDVRAGTVEQMMNLMGKKKHYYSIFPWGASQDPKSPHFDDQTPLYVEGAHKEVHLDQARIQAEAVSTSVIRTR